MKRKGQILTATETEGEFRSYGKTLIWVKGDGSTNSWPAGVTVKLQMKANVFDGESHWVDSGVSWAANEIKTETLAAGVEYRLLASAVGVVAYYERISDSVQIYG